MPAVDAPRVLVVADGEESGRAAAALLSGELAAGVRTCLRPDHALAQAQAHRAEVIVLALPSLALVERDAPALRETRAGLSAPPMLIALCDAASVGAAARLCRQGVIDDYVQHFPVPGDPHRLATSVRLAARIGARRPIVAPTTASDTRRRSVRRRDAADRSSSSSRMTRRCTRSSRRCSLPMSSSSSKATAPPRSTASTRSAPDLVLMDIVLPGSDGVAITEQMKATPDLAAIPVVMLTGEARFETLVRSMQAGAADFIVKPFTRDALVAKLGKFLPAVA